MEQVLAGTSKIIVDGKGVTPVLPLPQMLPPPAVVATAPKAKE
jgi:hypothetical protein